MRSSFKAALEKISTGGIVTGEDLTTILKTTDKDEINALFVAADKVRSSYMGEEVHFRGIIEFSNHCLRNCLYCGLRRNNDKIRRYRMSPGEIINACDKAAAAGFKTIVLQSGEDTYYSTELLMDLISQIKQRHDVAVTLSLGERSVEFYKSLRHAGADRYLLKHETSDPDLFARLRPGTNLHRRLECLKHLKKLGFEVGSGNMVGLPGQEAKTLAEDILLMQELNVDMAGVGPFIPSEYTPLARHPRGGLFPTLKVIALTRLVLPRVNIPATTALGTIHPRGREMALRCGANVIMPNITPPEFRRHYQIYPGKESLISGSGKLENLQNLVRSLGRKISQNKGSAPTKQI